MSKYAHQYRVVARYRDLYHDDVFVMVASTPSQARRRLERENRDFDAYRITVWQGEERDEPTDFELLIPGVGE